MIIKDIKELLNILTTEEICYALVAMNGYVYDDLKVQLKEKGIFNFN